MINRNDISKLALIGLLATSCAYGMGAHDDDDIVPSYESSSSSSSSVSPSTGWLQGMKNAVCESVSSKWNTTCGYANAFGRQAYGTVRNVPTYAAYGAGTWAVLGALGYATNFVLNTAAKPSGVKKIGTLGALLVGTGYLIKRLSDK